MLHHHHGHLRISQQPPHLGALRSSQIRPRPPHRPRVRRLVRPNPTAEQPGDPDQPSGRGWTPAHTNQTQHPNPPIPHPATPTPTANSPKPPAPAGCPLETSDTPSVDAPPATAPTP